MASDTGSSSRLIVRAATSALLSFALLLPANAQFWGNSWGGRQQPYNPYGGGFGGYRQWDYWGYRQRERAPSPRVRERPREVEKEQPPDYSHAPPAAPRKDATIKIVVMGDANADWLAYGLEDSFSENPEIAVRRAAEAVDVAFQLRPHAQECGSVPTPLSPSRLTTDALRRSTRRRRLAAPSAVSRCFASVVAGRRNTFGSWPHAQINSSRSSRPISPSQ